MIKIERTPQRLVLQSGSTIFTFDRDAAKLVLQRKLLLWARKPMERPLADVAGVNVDTGIDRASGVELCSVMIVMRDGSAWALPHTDKQDATAAADAIRGFLGISRA